MGIISNIIWFLLLAVSITNDLVFANYICHYLKDKFNIIPGKSWGTLSESSMDKKQMYSLSEKFALAQDPVRRP